MRLLKFCWESLSFGVSLLSTGVVSLLDKLMSPSSSVPLATKFVSLANYWEVIKLPKVGSELLT
jgi:hypothetical protein